MKSVRHTLILSKKFFHHLRDVLIPAEIEPKQQSNRRLPLTGGGRRSQVVEAETKTEEARSKRCSN